MYVLPGTGAVIGMAATLISAASRLPVRAGAMAAIVLSAAFLLADGLQDHWSNPLALAFSASGLAFAYLATGSVRRIRQERERAEALLAELQQTRAAEIERAALAERTRIAREIHDVLAHTLSALAVQLEGTRMLIEQRPGDPAALAAVERAHRLASEGLAEARRAIGALRGDSLPGADGLRQLADDFSAATGTPTTFDVDGEPIPLTPESQLALYRTAQEALTNVRKHARSATSVRVQLCYTADGAELVVEDTAPGGAPPERSPTGYGLLGMRERAELVGGRLDAAPSPAGFRVRLWLPRT
jgi:signal transduction histidine kinase